MLVLSRKLGESIRIGENVRITIARIDGHSVRIGIEAPLSVSIKRQEIIFEAPSEEAAERILEAVSA